MISLAIYSCVRVFCVLIEIENDKSLKLIRIFLLYIKILINLQNLTS